jgi:DNA-binding beta-propeller fold protein YncE
MLSPIPVTMLGWDPLDYASTTSMLRTGVFIALFFIIAVAIGFWWNPVLWLQNAFIFYAIFIVFYTTFFTNGNGFFTGIVGSLGYWLSQQGVERGSQPRYYYALIQMPVYEFLAYLGTVLAVYFGIKYARFSTIPGFAPAHAPHEIADTALPQEEPAVSADLVESPEEEQTPAALELERNLQAERDTFEFYRTPRPLPVLGFLLFWAITSLLAYTVAGERMPWLTVHVTLGFLLASGWGIGYLIDTTDWRQITRLNGLLAVLLFPVLFAGLASFSGGLLGANPPFQGNTIDQLQATTRFLIAAAAVIASVVGIFYLLRDIEGRQVVRLAAVTFLALMTVLTARAAYRASFINYDYATEYLVYAHAAPGPKLILEQVEELSRRTAGGKSIQVAYSSDALYPYWWYLRDYPNHRWFQSNPTRDLRDFPVIIAGDDVSGKIDPIVGDHFIRTDYMRLWWPNQDYYNLTWDRIWSAVKDREMRTAVFEIWLNRDYSRYARLTNQESIFRPETWSPAARVRLYVRKDIIANIWEYGASPVTTAPEDRDPFLANMIELSPIHVVGGSGSQPGEFLAPRGMAFAPDGSLYVADSRNNRIQHFAGEGTLLNTWGTFADQSQGNAAGGTFYEPWDVAVGPDGSVYVSDTWNHRVQKFTADGRFQTMWGYFGQGEAPEAFWGPRGLAVDQQGRVYVMDTGNKRVVIFDADGGFISQFGTAGFERGQFNEPVGIALDNEGNAYITDTWNQRVQVLAPSQDGLFFVPLRAWDITGWQGQSLDNKPLLAVSPVNGHIFVTDPEHPRVLEFDSEGSFIRGWGDYSSGPDGFGLASGVAVSPDGEVWVSDGANNLLLRFRLPE